MTTGHFGSIFLEIAMHFAFYGHPIDAYLERVEDLLQSIGTLSSEKSPLIVSLVQNPFYLTVQDGRTLSRLTAMFDLAARRFVDTGLAVVPGWEATLPFLLAVPYGDKGHAATQMELFLAPLVTQLICMHAQGDSHKP